MIARVTVQLKSGVLDPQGRAIANALHGLGFEEVRDARAGKLIELDLGDAVSPEAARARVDAMCRQLIANTVIEAYQIELAGGEPVR